MSRSCLRPGEQGPFATWTDGASAMRCAESMGEPGATRPPGRKPSEQSRKAIAAFLDREG